MPCRRMRGSGIGSSVMVIGTGSDWVTVPRSHVAGRGSQAVERELRNGHVVGSLETRSTTCDLRLATCDDLHSTLTRSYPSHRDMSEMITFSPCSRPPSISTVLTDVRPSRTLTRIASVPSPTSLK